MPGSSSAWRVRVYYEDTDAAGIVYHANYLRFMERARTEWLRGLGYEQARLRATEGVLFVITHADVNFLHPARFDQELLITTVLERLRRASMSLHQRIEDSTGRAICTAENTIACVDAATLAPHRIPAHLTKVFDSAQ